MMPDSFEGPQAPKSRGWLTALAVRAIVDIVDGDNNSRQDHDGRAVHSDDNAQGGRLMNRTRRGRTRAQPLRSMAPTRRSARSAISLDALNRHLGYFIRRVQVWVFQDFIRTLAQIDISPAQFSVLVVISANPGLSQAELAATLGIERARLARLLHRLQRRGLTQRLESSDDGRRHALQLTSQGRTLLIRAKTLAVRHERRLIEKLGAARHGTLLAALRDF
jgi:DNA-binding MarR family transcriptional regulator